MTIFRTACLALLCCAAIEISPAVGASSAPPWGDAPYGYRVVDQDLPTLLREFGRNTGVPVRVSPKVTGQVQSTPANLPPREFLERLAATHGLAWYYDGSALHVTAADEVQAKVIELPVDVAVLRGMLEDMGAFDERYPIKAAEQQGVAVVNGPPSYVSIIEQTIDVLRRRSRAEVVVLRGGAVGSVR